MFKDKVSVCLKSAFPFTSSIGVLLVDYAPIYLSVSTSLPGGHKGTADRSKRENTQSGMHVKLESTLHNVIYYTSIQNQSILIQKD